MPQPIRIDIAPGQPKPDCGLRLSVTSRSATADLHTVHIAECLILNSDFPRSIRFAAGRIQESLGALELTGRPRAKADHLAGRLLASLDYGQVDEILGDLPAYLAGIVRQTAEIDVAVHQQYVDYPIDAGAAARAILADTCPVRN